MFSFLICSAQLQKKVVKIESWETLEISKSQWHIDTLLVKGTLIIKDRRNIKLSADTIIVDGGLFQIGTPENPFRNKVAFIT